MIKALCSIGAADQPNCGTLVVDACFTTELRQMTQMWFVHDN